MAKGKLARYNELMFQTVNCTAYLKKVKDGRYIQKIEKEFTQSGRVEWVYMWYEDGEAKEKEVPDDEWGGSDFIKTYYERTAKEFVGIVVGGEMVTAKAMLYLDYNDYTGGEYVVEYPTEQIKCAKVYYGYNKSRFVPLDSLTIIFDEIVKND